jgi:hypothetical protein
MDRGPSNGLASNPVVAELVGRWEQDGLAWPDFCAAAALYLEMIALREGRRARRLGVPEPDS